MTDTKNKNQFKSKYTQEDKNMLLKKHSIDISQGYRFVCDDEFMQMSYDEEIELDRYELTIAVSGYSIFYNKDIKK